MIHKVYNHSILNGLFSDTMMIVDITPYKIITDLLVFYRLCQNFLKRKCMMTYISLCCFRKGYSTQYCLVAMLERFNKALVNKSKFGALLTDLSKAFDCLNHELLITKLEAYGFDTPSLIVVLDYLSKRKHRTKIDNIFSEWADILSGIPQGSILGPLLFNIYINDIFYFIHEYISSYADDTTPYSVD